MEKNETFSPRQRKVEAPDQTVPGRGPLTDNRTWPQEFCCAAVCYVTQANTFARYQLPPLVSCQERWGLLQRLSVVSSRGVFFVVVPIDI